MQFINPMVAEFKMMWTRIIKLPGFTACTIW